MSIKARLIITISLVIAIVFGLIGVVVVNATENRMIARVDRSLRIAPRVPPRLGNENNRLGQFFDSRRETATLVLDTDGNLRWAEPAGYADDPEPLPAITLDDLNDNAGDIYTTGSVDGSNLDYRVIVHQFNGGFLVQAAPLDIVEATLNSLIWIISIAGIIVLVVVTLAVWISVNRGLRPIDDMIGTAGLIAAGDLSHRVEHDNAATEVGRLGQALNAMLNRIESSFAAKERSEQRLRQFVADASHELRTPLTSIRGYAELFRSGAADDPAALERVMLRIESESTRMGALVEDLLLLARLDLGRPLERKPVDLVDLVADVVMDARAIEPDRPLTCDLPAAALVSGDADRLRQVVVNLVTNARVHTDPETPIHVSIRTTDDEIILRVADEGPGMAGDDAARAFDRFYRVDVSRARSSGGSGLGLSIVASIVEAHGGKVGLETAIGHGTTVTLTLARLDPASDPSPVEQEPVSLD